MDKLYPIIRRKRRPLIEADVPPAPAKVAPVKPAVETPLEKIAKPDDVENPATTESA